MEHSNQYLTAALSIKAEDVVHFVIPCLYCQDNFYGPRYIPKECHVIFTNCHHGENEQQPDFEKIVTRKVKCIAKSVEIRCREIPFSFFKELVEFKGIPERYPSRFYFDPVTDNEMWKSAFLTTIMEQCHPHEIHLKNLREQVVIQGADTLVLNNNLNKVFIPASVKNLRLVNNQKCEIHLLSAMNINNVIFDNGIPPCTFYSAKNVGISITNFFNLNIYAVPNCEFIFVFNSQYSDISYEIFELREVNIDKIKSYFLNVHNLTSSSTKKIFKKGNKSIEQYLEPSSNFKQFNSINSLQCAIYFKDSTTSKFEEICFYPNNKRKNTNHDININKKQRSETYDSDVEFVPMPENHNVIDLLEEEIDEDVQYVCTKIGFTDNNLENILNSWEVQTVDSTQITPAAENEVITQNTSQQQGQENNLDIVIHEEFIHDVNDIVTILRKKLVILSRLEIETVEALNDNVDKQKQTYLNNQLAMFELLMNSITNALCEIDNDVLKPNTAKPKNGLLNILETTVFYLHQFSTLKNETVQYFEDRRSDEIELEELEIQALKSLKELEDENKMVVAINNMVELIRRLD